MNNIRKLQDAYHVSCEQCTQHIQMNAPGNNTKALVMMDGTFHGNSRRGHWEYVRTLEIVDFLARQQFCVSHDYIEKVANAWVSFKT